MKHVFSNSYDVLHLFAQRTQNNARCENVYFEGNTAYSYGRHFPLATFHEKKGKTVVLLNDTKYSSTTSRHQTQARQALSHYTIIPVSATGCEYKTDHAINIDFFETHIVEDAAKAMKAVKHAQGYINSMNYWIAQGNKYIAFFNLKKVPFKSLIDSKKAKSLIEKQRQESKEERERRKRIEAEREAERQDRIERWLKGEYQYGVDSKYQLLRLKDFWTVETSKSVEFPLSHARLALARILDCRNNGIAWHRNGAEIRVGTFHIDSIDENGNVRAGCHKIQFSEIERFAKLTNLMKG